MKQYLLNSLLATVVCLFTLHVDAQITLVKKGSPKARIVFDLKDSTSVKAASLLSVFVSEITGTQLPLVVNGKVNKTDYKKPSAYRKNDIVLINKGSDRDLEDSFSIETKDGRVFISGYDKGVIYGVVTLLDSYIGVRYYTYKTYDLPPHTKTLVLPNINIHDKPAFRYRQTQSYATKDEIFKMWYRLEEPVEEFAGNLWVHTFNRILPASVYGEKHPEWYSLINGKRQPGTHSQWCLTNEEVFETAAEKIDSIFKSNPSINMISVSQNDGNNTQWQCENCQKVDSIEGSASGNLVRFMNKLAKRFPDKQFSTLAYLYSMQPPRITRPLPNINIMLCDIDCKREVPLTDNASGQYFMKAIEGWSKISDNIFVWDYGINFDNVVSPFPNFHILQPNMKIFKNHNAKMVFEQINSSIGTDLSELRTALCAKLMWNPDLNVDSLTNVFLQGYYGKAGHYIKEYIKTITDALSVSNIPLWIYDSPITHKDGMLSSKLRRRYNELFDKAEDAVTNDIEKLQRVQIARLPLMYADLEISRTEQNRDYNSVLELLNRFEEWTDKYGVPTLNERKNKPKDYCRLYRERYLPTNKTSKALGANVIYTQEPSQTYMKIADKAITDGLYGGTTYVESWVGWEGKDAEFVIDLGSEKSFNTIETDFLHQLGAWILLPKGGRYTISSDGKNYTDFGAFSFEEDRDISVKFVPGKVEKTSNVKARYIKVFIETIGTCPNWHYGVGYPAWFFIDEVNVY